MKRWIYGFFLLGLSLFAFFKGQFKQNRRYTKVEIDSSFPHLPYFCLELEGTKHRMLLDLGMNIPIGMQSSALDKIQHKKILEESFVKGQKGHKYPCTIYLFPTVKMGQYIVSNVAVMEENPALLNTSFYDETSASDKSEMQAFISAHFSGRIGWPFFESTNLMLDLGQRKCIYLLKDLDQIKQGHKYNLNDFTKTSFEINDYGILVSVMTDLGIKKLLLDTGADTSLRTGLAPSEKVFQNAEAVSYYKTQTFQIGNYDFGETSFRLAKMEGLSGVDGVLGFDFCLQPIFIDFENKHIYIQPILK